MKKIFFAILILISAAQASAQLTRFVPYASRNRYIGIVTDSLFYAPVRDTNFIPERIGSIVTRPQDSCIYTAIGITAGVKCWTKLARVTDIITIDTSNKWVNLITKNATGDSVLFYIGGVRYAVKDSVGSGGGGSPNTSVGGGYKVAINSTNNIKSLKEKYGLILDSATTNEVGLTLDSASLYLTALRRKDSLTAGNLLGYITRKILADSMAAGRAYALSISGGGGVAGFHADTIISFSGAGIVSDASLDSNSTTFGSDQTAAINALYNIASSGKSVYLINDVKASVTGGIKVYSNTYTYGLPGKGLILRNNSNQPMFINADTAFGDRPCIDKNITFDGGIYNGNNGNSGLSPAQSIGTTAMGLTHVFAMYGVEGLTIKNLEIRKQRVYAIGGMNVDKFVYQNLKIDSGPNAGINSDGAHADAGSKQGIMWNLNITCRDDGIAMSADDLWRSSLGAGSLNYYPANVAADISDIDVGWITFNNSFLGIRASTGKHRLDRINIHNIGGTVTGYGFIGDGVQYYRDSVFMAGVGHGGDLKITNYNVVFKDTGVISSTNKSMINIDANWDNVTINGFKRNWSVVDHIPSILIGGAQDAHIGTLNINDYISNDTTNFVTEHIKNTVTIDNIVVNGAVVKSQNLIGSSKLIQNYGTVKRYNLTHITADSIATILDNSGTGASKIVASNILHNGTTGAASFTTTTNDDITLDNISSSLLTSGTYSSKKGSAFYDFSSNVFASASDNRVLYNNGGQITTSDNVQFDDNGLIVKGTNPHYGFRSGTDESWIYMGFDGATGIGFTDKTRTKNRFGVYENGDIKAGDNFTSAYTFWHSPASHLTVFEGDFYVNFLGNSAYKLRVGSSNQFTVDYLGNLHAAAPTYSSGGYDFIVRNQTTGDWEKTTISGGGGTIGGTIASGQIPIGTGTDVIGASGVTMASSVLTNTASQPGIAATSNSSGAEAYHIATNNAGKYVAMEMFGSGYSGRADKAWFTTTGTELGFFTTTSAPVNFYTNNTLRQSIDGSGNIYNINKTYMGGGATPTALVDVAPGTTFVAPFRLNSGSNLTTPIAGVWEFDGTHFYATPVSTRKKIPLVNVATATNGYLPIGNGTDFTLASITSTDGTIAVTNGAGSIDVAMPYYARNYQSGKTANFNVISYTVPNDGNVYVFDIAAGINITTASGGSVTTTITYTDETNASRTVTYHNDGTATTALTAAGTSDFNVKGEVKCYPNTSVTITNTVSGSVTYSTSASLLFKTKIGL